MHEQGAISNEHTLEFLLGFDGRVHHFDQGYWLKFEVKRVMPTPARPHGLRYAFTLHDPEGKRLMGFDNAHAVAPQGSRYRKSAVAHACFRHVTDAGCEHQAIRTGSGSRAVRTPAFKWVNTALGNIKSAIVGTYRAISSKHVPRYLAEFEYRFNRRYDLASMIPRLGSAAVHTPPMPYRLLKLADYPG